ncbi:MAG TPA: RNA 3'-terminal phosphate cyclase, partial [Polyangiaceae bacterium]|nr:RNA 3'-terminal phosphate cyclase [Polyangiaceae bacterium]
LRSSLALALLTPTPLRIHKIRAGRARPGLMRQHLAAVHAAASISGAQVSGAELGSTELWFRPGSIRGGDYRFAIGSAGSTTLLFQTILLPLLLGATTSSRLHFEGGTHNPMAPPFDFLERVFLPLLARMGARVEVALQRHGFYPAGGGQWSATVYPVERLGRLDLLERGSVRAKSARALCAAIPGSVGVRQVDALSAALGWERSACRPQMVAETRGPGNALLASIESEHVTELVTGFGERGVPAEHVAVTVAEQARRYLAADVPVGEHLADQLLLPLALGSGGAFRTLKPSLHCATQLQLLRAFSAATASAVEERDDVWRIDVDAARNSAKDKAIPGRDGSE